MTDTPWGTDEPRMPVDDTAPWGDDPAPPPRQASTLDLVRDGHLGVVPVEAGYAFVLDDGQVVTLADADDEWLLAWLKAYKEQAERALLAKGAVDREMTRRLDSRGSRSMPLPGGGRVKVPAPHEPDWDGDVLRSILESLASEGTVDVTVVDKITPLKVPKVYITPLKTLLASDIPDEAKARIRAASTPSTKKRGAVTVETN